MGTVRGGLPGAILDGPVCTRVARGALCVSFLPPGCRLCTFDCTYCPFEHGKRREGWPSPGAIGTALAHALRRSEPVDAIAITGPGEQTLHPRFGLAVANVLAARQLRPELPVRVTTNGTTVRRPQVRRILDLVDERIVRLDAGAERISRPFPGAHLGTLIASLASLRDFSVESVFVEGPGANTDGASVAGWLELVAELQPRRAYVTTIERAPAEPGPRPASLERLEEIAARVRHEAGVLADAVP